ncbi:arrestin domain-containing protein 17-like isoform X1 [Neodiprion virginianus]|uniref:arrestin domain-containing protein 17-like isoform X1 n=1 Tax=Neodiprion virginianus TaxID=2961670 RepID=UPI001EE75DA4|nr:arrestin domain-containing protein 17-like isoform X1 [Neodiprion virginianus]XP_046623607.1 arrestin domain-containing protein 17-like isoform X1 [Neodiprion virginianus]
MSVLCVIWATLSIIASVFACSGFYLPYWIQGRLLGKADAYFSSFRRCNYPRLRAPNAAPEIVYECARYSSFWDIPSAWWQASTVTIGVGVALAVITTLTLLAAASSFLPHILRMTRPTRALGSLQLLADSKSWGSMGLSRFEIILDNPYGIYYAGCPISGNVYIDVDSPKKVRGIEVRYKGEAKVRWKPEGGNQIRKANETYMDIKCIICGDGEREFEIPEGSHVFPFTWMLPTNIPGSFESLYGRVRYTVKAVIDRPWKFDHVLKVPFTVVPILDLNREPLSSEPINEENHKTFWGHSEPLYMSVSLPVRGYVPGQNIPIKAKLNNMSGVDVEKLRVVLKKLVTFHALGDSRTRKEVITDFEANVDEGQDLVLINLKLPSLPPSGLQHCKIIEVDYKLKVEARVEGWYNKNLKVRMDIIIGTIPLLTYQVPQHTVSTSAVGFEGVTSPLPSAPNQPESQQETFVFPTEIEEYSSSLPKSTFEKCENYKASKREKDESPGEDTDGDSDEEIASSFDPKYTVYEFGPVTPTN